MARNTSPRFASALRPLLCAVTIVAALCVALLPTKAWAGREIAYAKADGYNIAYFEIEGALKGAFEGRTVILETDWEVEDTIEIPDSKSVTIDLNGYSITNTSGKKVFRLCENSSLTLQSGASREFTYTGYKDDQGNTDTYKVTTGGLITGCTSQSDGSCGISMDANAHLTLDNVAVAGNRGKSAGGIHSEKNCTIEMKNGASVQHNEGASGGGLYVESETTIKMDNASINYNYAEDRGGAIHSNGDATRVFMTSGSSMSYNKSHRAGGAIYLRGSYFHVESADGTGEIGGNSSGEEWNGGAVYVDDPYWSSCEGTFKNLTFKNNYSDGSGGALYLSQSYTNVVGCTLTGNKARLEGGAIDVNSGHNALTNCTITDNVCNLAGEARSGGGVFVGYKFDIELNGDCIVKNNTNGVGGAADDIFLSSDIFGITKAYVTGGVSANSSVGVRTESSGTRMVGKNIKTYTNGTYFIDGADGYYITHGSDHGGDLWQRSGSDGFLAKVNGVGSTRYREGSRIFANGKASEENKVFWYWDASATTGMNPVSDFINSGNMYSPFLHYSMPQNDTNAIAVYADRVKKAIVGLEQPVAGESLPTYAEFVRTDVGVGAKGAISVPLTWYEVAQDGTRSVASGKAKPGTTYVAQVGISEQTVRGLFISRDITADDVTVRTVADGSSTDAKPSSATVDTVTNALIVETTEYKTEGDAADVELGKITVNRENGGLEALSGNSAAEVALDLDDESTSVTSLGSVEVSYVKGSDSVTIAAGEVEGMNFCAWEGVEAAWINDVEGTITIPAESLTDDLVLTAVYTPVVTEAEASMDAPVAGESLATTVSSLKIKTSDGQAADLVELLGGSELSVSWSPADEDGKADYSTSYTAIVEIMNGSDMAGVEKVLSETAKVTVNGTEVSSAGFAVVDGKLCLCLAFSETAKVKLMSVGQPGDVELSFDEALGCQANQDAHSGDVDWPLAKSVALTLENGEKVVGEIDWEVPAGFDANASEAQEFTVKGTVELPSDVDQNGVSLEVTATVKVAAPQTSDDDGDKDNDSDDTGKKTDDNTDDKSGEKTDGSGESADDQGKSDSKSGLPKAGDASQVPVALACGAGVMIVADAAVLRRRKA